MPIAVRFRACSFSFDLRTPSKRKRNKREPTSIGASPGHPREHRSAAFYVARGRSQLMTFAAGFAMQQQPPLPIQDGQVIPLWTGSAPGALGSAETDIPTLTVFLPRTMAANTPAVIVCPGGGYVSLAANHEGRQVASYLNSLGIAAFVLRYRLGPRYHHPVELGDAQRAIRMLRSKATEWRLDSAKNRDYVKWKAFRFF